MSLHTIGDGALTATIDSFGAQLQSLRLDATEYLWDAGDPWRYSAPVLFPIISGLPGGELQHHGRRYPIPSHGFARRTEWNVLANGRFELAASAATREQYPFEFRLQLEFAVSDALTVTHTVHNDGDEPLPYLLGGHPAFRWPLPGATGEHEVSWSHGGETMRQAVGGLRPGRIDSPAVDGHLVLQKRYFAEDALLFDDITPRSVSYTAPGAARVTMRYDDFAVLGIWSKSEGADFVCLEPWSGYPAAGDFDGDIVNLPGIELLAPGESRTVSYSIAIEGAELA
jgi:galactose mutarotase-like enzyme